MSSARVDGRKRVDHDDRLGKVVVVERGEFEHKRISRRVRDCSRGSRDRERAERATKVGVVIDPGGDADQIHAAVTELGIELKEIWLTHGHLDHCGEAGVLAKELGLRIEGPHEADRFWIARLEEDGAKYGMNAEVFEPDRWLVDGDTVTVGELTLEVIHCPGHTPGHVVFFNRESKFAVVGDVLFQGSIGRTDFPMGNHQDLIDAITQKLWPLGNDVTFIPGHGPTSTFGAERRSNPFVGDAALA